MATTDDTIRKNISQNITKYREKAGLSQKELANRLSVTPSRVSNWEQGANCPTIDILFEVCKVLNVSINDIYGVYNDTNVKLTFQERQMLEKYRVLDNHGKEMVDFTLQKEWERSTSISAINETSNNRTNYHYSTENNHFSMVAEALVPYKTNAANKRTDISAPEGTDTSDDDIMDSENF